MNPEIHELEVKESGWLAWWGCSNIRETLAVLWEDCRTFRHLTFRHQDVSAPGHLGTRTSWHQIIGPWTFRHQNVSALGYSIIELKSIFQITMMVSGGSVVVPPFQKTVGLDALTTLVSVCACNHNWSALSRIRVLKIPRAIISDSISIISWCRNVLVPKSPGAEVSVAETSSAEFSGAKMCSARNFRKRFGQLLVYRSRSQTWSLGGGKGPLGWGHQDRRAKRGEKILQNWTVFSVKNLHFQGN